MGASGLPEPATVVVGISDGRNTEIIRGLSEGDTILTGVAGAQPAAGEQQGQGGQGGNRGGGRGGRGAPRFL
jgi:HlyD family secretion protein